MMHMCVDVNVCAFTHSCLHFSAGWRESMRLLHHTAGEVTNSSLLLSIIGVLHLKTCDITDVDC